MRIHVTTGLTMELYIQQHEYVSGLVDMAGIRVQIHNKTVVPFPEDKGLSLQPGLAYQLGIARVLYCNITLRWAWRVGSQSSNLLQIGYYCVV